VEKVVQQQYAVETALVMQQQYAVETALLLQQPLDLVRNIPSARRTPK
jgi:hypothetical protein